MTTAAKEFVLYNYFRSSSSYRVRIAMHLKGIDFEYRPVHLLNNGGEQHQADYVKLNPAHEVPTLVHGGKTVAQSVAIVDYLENVKPTPHLFPQEAHKRALTLQACEIINSGIQPMHNLGLVKLLGEKLGATEAQKEEWMQHWIRRGLETLEAFLKPHAGKYSIGDEVTAADCFLIPQLFAAERFKVAIAGYPTLMRIQSNCNELDAFKKSAPAQQPDFQKT